MGNNCLLGTMIWKEKLEKSLERKVFLSKRSLERKVVINAGEGCMQNKMNIQKNVIWTMNSKTKKKKKSPLPLLI